MACATTCHTLFIPYADPRWNARFRSLLTKRFCPLFTGRRTSRQYRFDYSVNRGAVTDLFEGHSGPLRNSK